MPLVQTKTLIPKERRPLLRRDRLVNFLHEHIDRQLIIISASAGYGKTSLLIDFASDTDLPVCWYSLDESDRDLRDFLEYFVAAIEQRFPDQLPETRRALANWGGDSQGEALAGLLVNEILHNIPDYFVLVLDDYHLVDDIVAINLFLDAFLRYQPDNCRLIISSRTIPTLTPRGMALLVARQQIAGLGVKDLRFTAEEIRALIAQNYGEELTLEQAEELARESEGWITGILLTRHRMWKGLFADLIQVRGEMPGVYTYLANEVFSQLDQDRQEFLEATSILNDMSPDLCNALLGRHDSQAILEELEERNLFTTRVERGPEVWYRYHRLFREFLNAKLKARGAGREISLHMKAGRYLEEKGYSTEAIHHYLEAGAYLDAARVIDQVAEAVYDGGRLDSLLHWIDCLPEEVLSAMPRLAWFKAKILWNRGNLPESIVYSERAKEGFQRLGNKVGVAQALIEKSGVLRIQGRFQEALKDCAEALATLAGESLQGRDIGVLAGVYRNLGSCHWQLGDLSLGIEEMRKALELYRQAGYEPNLARTHSDLGVLLRTAGNLSASHYHFEQALKIWEKEGNIAGIASALNSIGVSHYMRGDYEKALDVYEIALQRAREAASDRLCGFVLAGMGDTYLACGNIEQAIQAYEQSQSYAQRIADTYLAGYVLGALSMAHLLRGELTQALDLARQAFERASEQGAKQEAATYQIVLGAVYYQQGRMARALDFLTQAVKTLRENRAYRDMARAQLHLAQAYYRAGRLHEAEETIDELTDTILDLGQDQFLVPEARLALPLLEYAVGRGVGGEILAGLLQRAKAHHELLRTERRMAVPQEEAEPSVRFEPLRAYAFGPTRVFRGDKEIPSKAWGTAKARQLFFYLLSNPGQRKEEIGDVLWPDLPAAKVRSTFHITLYRVRRALQMNEVVTFENDEYRINRQLDVWYDVREFERLLDEADRIAQQSPDEAAEKRREAIALVRGEFCKDLPETDWQTEKRHTLTLRYLDALMHLGNYHLSRGEIKEALTLFQRALAWDDLHEEAHRKVMQCLGLLGDLAGVSKHYHALVDRFRQEMGVAPSPETERLYQRLVAGNGAKVN